jgi:hypothetical protein
MPNRNYISGRNFEYRTKRFFEKMDYFVMRAYGSKGIFDLVCFPPFVKDGWFNAPLGIQCKKNGYVPPQEREKLNSVKNKWQMVILIAWSEQKRTCTKNCQKNHRHVRKGELMLATLDMTQITKEALDINNLLKK